MSRNIAILAPSPAPYQLGGAEKLFAGLYGALERIPGVFPELIKLPCREGSFADLIQAYKMYYELDLSHFDMVISTKYPSWMAFHKNHVVYMLHALRGFYDAWHMTGLPDQLRPVPRKLRDLVSLLKNGNAGREDLPKLFELCERAMRSKSLPSFVFRHPGPLLRSIVRFMDRIALAETNIRSYAAISATVAAREGYFPPGAEVKVIYPPPLLDKFFCKPGEYIFSCSRLHSTKRIQLLIEAMAYVQSSVILKIAGTGPEEEALKKLAARDPRIEFLGFVPDEQLPDLYSRALFVPFIPYDEDYGLITVEAMRSGKPVLTLKDSGGVCELVEDGVNGLCVDAEAECLGKAMDRLARDPALCQRMGQAAKDKVRGINWDACARELLTHADYAPLARLRTKRRKILLLSSYPARRHGGGGEKRLWQLCRLLAENFDVLLLSIGGRSSRVLDVRNEEGFFNQLVWPWPEVGKGLSELVRTRDLASVDDVQIMEWCGTDPAFLQLLKEQAADASCLVASQPYLFPALEAAEIKLPLFYAAPDVEWDVKEGILSTAPELLEEVRKREKACVASSRAILACSQENKARFAQLYGFPEEKIFVLPNGVDDPDLLFASPAKRREGRRALPSPWAKTAFFIGSGHKPNQEAVREIIKIAVALPQVQFIIAGSVSRDWEIERLKRPANVHLAGTVSEKAKRVLLSTCDLALNPISSGSGTNLKILEYIAAGIACVSTPFGMRGIDPQAGEAVLVRELPDFPQAISEILARPLPEKILKKAADHVAANASWSETLRAAPEILNQFLAEERSA